jgi:glutaredoxin
MEIFLYTEPGCPACTDAKAFLITNGIPFTERNVSANPEFRRILHEDLDSCTTPTLTVDQEVIVGFDRLKFQLLARRLGLAQPIPPGARPARRDTFMNPKRIVLVLSLLALGLPLRAQMAVGPRMPDLRGVWNPVVGGGATYEMTDPNGEKSQFEITVIGKEEAQGKPGYWMEVVMDNARMGGQMLAKYLLIPGTDGMSATKMVMQMPGQDPMEMDLTNMPMARHQMSTPTDIRDKADKVGSESVTVPAGTFTCEHYHAKDGTGDVWVSDKVGPWGLVKMQNTGGRAMVLVKQINDAKDRITGTPKPFDPSQMMRGMPGRQHQ